MTLPRLPLGRFSLLDRPVGAIGRRHAPLAILNPLLPLGRGVLGLLETNGFLHASFVPGPSGIRDWRRFPAGQSADSGARPCSVIALYSLPTRPAAQKKSNYQYC